MGNPLLAISAEVQAARDQGTPIVALESSVISHGLPWPDNLAAARDCEERVRRAGVVPATVAVIDGKMCIGLGEKELERLARAENIAKASPRDFPVLLAQQRSGATTVAGTLFLARLAGIHVLATGGIGGVHRDALQTGDVSADLIELARSAVMVVCSGPKAILDLPRTLEMLESLGVPIVGYRTNELPAFFARSSGLRLDARVDGPSEAAELMRAARSLRSHCGIVLTNPPPEHLALPYDELEQIVDTALVSAESARVQGKALTPFLLEQLRAAAGPRALAINRAILCNNAQLGAEIARALAR
jgi:pseudouridine-5'-phosphate glycosidase